MPFVTATSPRRAKIPTRAAWVGVQAAREALGATVTVRRRACIHMQDHRIRNFAAACAGRKDGSYDDTDPKKVHESRITIHAAITQREMHRVVARRACSSNRLMS